MPTPLAIRLNDEAAERVRQSHHEELLALRAALPWSRAKIVRGVLLPNGIEVEVPHGLGAAPTFVGWSPPMNLATAGVIALFGGAHSGGAPIDRSKVIVLQASGYGATVTVDLLVAV